MPQEPGKGGYDAVATFLRDCHITVNTYPIPPHLTVSQISKYDDQVRAS